MIDPDDRERAAIRAAMRPVAEIMEETGWATRFADLTEAQVLTLIEVAVGGYLDALQRDAAAREEAPF